MLAVGFADSRIKIWSLVPQKLKTMKNAEQLQDVNLETGKIVFHCIHVVVDVLSVGKEGETNSN